MNLTTKETIALMFWREVDAVLLRNDKMPASVGEINDAMTFGATPFSAALNIVKMRMEAGK